MILIRSIIFIILSLLCSFVLEAQTIFKCCDGNNICYKNSLGKTIVRSKKYTISREKLSSKENVIIGRVIAGFQLKRQSLPLLCEHQVTRFILFNCFATLQMKDIMQNFYWSQRMVNQLKI